MMIRPFLYLMLYLLLFCAAPLAIHAETAWVSDVLILTFREGPGNSYPVIKTITSNTALEILEEQNDFLKVQLTSGDIGWVDKKYIIYEEPNAILLAREKKAADSLKEKVTILESTIQELKNRLETRENELVGKITPLESDLKKALEENKQIQKELTASREKYDKLIEQSKNIQDIVQENTMLTKKNQAFSSELNSLKNKNKNQYKAAMIKWFLSGVGVLFLGWIIGQSVSSKKGRSSSLLD